MWRAEKYLNPEGRRQPPMFRPFAALIVGQGLAERRRDAAQCAGEALVRRQRIVAFQLAQTNTPGRAFVENTDRLGGLGLPDNQIAFPMPEGPRSSASAGRSVTRRSIQGRRETEGTPAFR